VTSYEMPGWAVCQVVRLGGLVEDVCEHGVGHPNRAWLAEHDPDGSRLLGVHGCDGCCVQGTETLKTSKQQIIIDGASFD